MFHIYIFLNLANFIPLTFENTLGVTYTLSHLLGPELWSCRRSAGGNVLRVPNKERWVECLWISLRSTLQRGSDLLTRQSA